MKKNINKKEIILENVIAEGLLDSAKNIAASTVNKVKDAANGLIEKFISNVGNLLVKSVDKSGKSKNLNIDSIESQLTGNKIINKLFGDKLSDIMTSLKSIGEDDLKEVMDESKINKKIEELPDSPTTNESIIHNKLLKLNRRTIITEDINADKILENLIMEAEEAAKGENKNDEELPKFSVMLDAGDSKNPIKFLDESEKEITDPKLVEKIKRQVATAENQKEDKAGDNTSGKKNDPEIKDANETPVEVSSASTNAAKWVLDRCIKVLDILQFPYNKEKLEAYLAKKINALNPLNEGKKLKGKMALVGVIFKWIGLITLIIMISKFALAGGLIGAAGYLGMKLSRKATSKIAMYGGKKYVEGQISKADKKAKVQYETINYLTRSEYLAKYKYAGLNQSDKNLLLKYSPTIHNWKDPGKKDSEEIKTVLFVNNNDPTDIVSPHNFKKFTKLLDLYILLYSNLSGKQGKYFNDKIDPNKTYVNAYNKLKEIDASL